jgi:RNA polymerase sigma-70 factor (ECF subfamily)
VTAASSLATSPPVVASITEVYRLHAADVARWAARLGGPQVDVEDVVQDVFLTAHRLLPEFRGEAKITTWLFRITQNQVRHRLRRLRLRRIFSSSDDNDLVAELPSHAPLPSDDLERKEARATVYRILDGMSEKYRTAFILFEIEKISGEEIAQLMNQKVATIWVWLHRARAQFLDGLEKLNKSERS